MTSRGHGREGRPWRRLVQQVRAEEDVCCRCGHPIDKALPPTHPRSFTVDHYPIPLSVAPWLAHDRDNLRAAHRDCNSSAGNRPPQPLTTSRRW